MDARCVKAMQLWSMAAQNNPNESRGLAPGVYFSVMDRAPPAGLAQISNALDLCDFIQRETQNRGLFDDEKVALIGVATEGNQRARWYVPLIRFLLVLPYFVAAFAAVAMFLRGFSWILLVTALLGMLWNRVARMAASRDDSTVATVHMILAWLAMVTCAGLSAVQLLGVRHVF